MHPILRPIVLLALVALAAACTLQPITAPTPSPYPTPRPLEGADTNEGRSVIFVTATPFGNPVGGAVDTGVNVSVDVDTGLPPDSNNAAEWMINRVIIPAWNFVYSFGFSVVGSLWTVAGVQGGWFAQALCCILPSILVIAFIVRRLLFGRVRLWG